MLEEDGRPSEAENDRDDQPIKDSIADEMFKELLNNMTVEHDSCDGSSQVFPEDPALDATYRTSEFHEDLNEQDNGVDELGKRKIGMKAALKMTTSKLLSYRHSNKRLYTTGPPSLFQSACC